MTITLPIWISNLPTFWSLRTTAASPPSTLGYLFRSEVSNATQLLQGRAGTEGYIAPEVGHTKFSPICADLWSIGQTVQKLCMRCPLSRDRLLALSNQLLLDDPSKRPKMSEVLQWMSNCDAVGTLHGDIRYLLTHVLIAAGKLSVHLFLCYLGFLP